MPPFLHSLGNDLSLEIWPNGNAGIMLFYPGSMLGPGHYSVLLSAFFRAGLSVAAMHLKGHGHQLSGKGRFRNFDFQTLLSQGLYAEHWLRANGYAHIAVAGHSQGGILTLAHAGTSPTIKAAFSIGAIFPQMAAAIELTRFRFLSSWRNQIIRLMAWAARYVPSLPVPLPVYLELSRIIKGRQRPLFMGKEKGRYCYPLAFLLSLFTATLSTSLHCPFWLFSATDDALFTRALTEQVFAMIKAPAKSLIWLYRGGHMAPFNPGIAEFIARTTASACAGLGFPLNLQQGVALCTPD